MTPALRFGLACAGALLFCLIWLMWAIDRCTRCRCTRKMVAIRNGEMCVVLRHDLPCPQYDPLDDEAA